VSPPIFLSIAALLGVGELCMMVLAVKGIIPGELASQSICAVLGGALTLIQPPKGSAIP
jgi:hypothetical protein